MKPFYNNNLILFLNIQHTTNSLIITSWWVISIIDIITSKYYMDIEGTKNIKVNYKNIIL